MRNNILNFRASGSTNNFAKLDAVEARHRLVDESRKRAALLTHYGCSREAKEAREFADRVERTTSAVQ